VSDSKWKIKLDRNFIRNNSGFRPDSMFDSVFGILTVMQSLVEVVGNDRPGWRARVCNGQDQGWGKLYVGPGWWSLTHSVPSQCMFAVTLVLVSVLGWVFVGPRRGRNQEVE